MISWDIPARGWIIDCDSSRGGVIVERMSTGSLELGKHTCSRLVYCFSGIQILYLKVSQQLDKLTLPVMRLPQAIMLRLSRLIIVHLVFDKLS